MRVLSWLERRPVLWTVFKGSCSFQLKQLAGTVAWRTRSCYLGKHSSTHEQWNHWRKKETKFAIQFPLPQSSDLQGYVLKSLQNKLFTISPTKTTLWRTRTFTKGAWKLQETTAQLLAPSRNQGRRKEAESWDLKTMTFACFHRQRQKWMYGVHFKQFAKQRASKLLVTLHLQNYGSSFILIFSSPSPWLTSV